MSKIIYWSPRILSIGYVLFLSLFALDVFGGQSGWNIIPALFMHLLPALILLAITLIAWNHDVAGITFLGFAIYYVWIVGLHRDWSWYVSIPGPAAVIGILFLVNWLQERKLNNN